MEEIFATFIMIFEKYFPENVWINVFKLFKLTTTVDKDAFYTLKSFINCKNLISDNV